MNEQIRLRDFLILIVLSGGVFVNALGNPFIFDDPVYVSNNPYLKNVGFISTYFTENFCKGAGRDCPFFRPIVSLTYLMDHLMWGNEPWGYRLTNITIHIVAVLLLYGVTLRLFGNHTISLVAALIFSVHPAHVESIAVIANRTDPPTSIFILLSLYFFSRHLVPSGGHPIGFLVLSAGAFAFALLTKEIAMTLPVLLLLYDLIFVRPWEGAKDLFFRLGSYAPYALVILFYFILRHRALGFGLTQDLEWEDFGRRLLMAPALIWDYFRLQVFPYPLTLSHGEPMLFGSQMAAALWGFLFLGVFLLGLLKSYRHFPGVTFGGLWFVITLLPVLNIVPIAWPMASERYSYIPSMGLAIVMGFIGEFLFRKVKQTKPVWVQKGLAGVFVAVLVILSLLTVQRNRVWSSETLLWEDTVRKAPDFALGHMNLGISHMKRGNSEKARRSLLRALELDPTYPKIRHNLGHLYQNSGETEKAMEHYQYLVENGEAFPATYYNSGILYEKMNEFEQALVSYRQALERYPDYYNARFRLGRLLARLNRPEAALLELQKASRIFPQRRESYGLMAELLRSMGRRSEAERAYRLYLKNFPPGKRGSPEFRYAEKRFREFMNQTKEKKEKNPK